MSKRGKITLEPRAGLCNRMRAIASAYFLGKSHNLEVEIIWNIDDLLNARFEDCFKEIEGVKIETRGTPKYFAKRVLQKLTNTKKPDKFIKVEDLKRLKREKNYDQQQFKDYFDWVVQEYRHIAVESDFDFYPHNFDIFQPIIRLNDVIESFSNRLNPDVIGVHIRRTDHIIAKETSSVEKFKVQIHKDLERNPNQLFFLATDDLEVQNMFAQQFNKNILLYSQNKSRNNKIGIEQAIIDLYLLSKTSKIYGSYWSSFSETASKIGNVELIIIK